MINLNIDIKNNELNKTEKLKDCVTKSLENYIIIHGSFGSPDGNWFPWLKKELEKQNKVVDVPQFPVGLGNQNYENWQSVLKKLAINENTTIIAHSIGPIFVCKYLITNKIKVKKLIFVQGFNNGVVNYEYDEVNKTFFMESGLEDIKNYCNNIICYYSDNETYVKNTDEIYKFADIVSTEKHCIRNGGHINSESGYTEFKEILDSI